MLAGVSSLPFAETAKTQVCVGKLSSPYKFKVCRRKLLGLATDPFLSFNFKSPRVTRAEVLSLKRGAQSKPSSARFKADNPRQDLQGLKGIFNQQAEAPAKTSVGLEQQGSLKADTNSKPRPGRTNPSHNQPDAQSKRPSSAASLGSPHAEKKPDNTLPVTRGRDVRPTKRRGSRNSTRGFDVLDELMSSQGRSSRAVLESLQSAAVMENDDMPYVHPHNRDYRASPSLSGKVSTSEFAQGKNGGIMSQMLSDFRRMDTRPPTHEATTDTVPTSSTFASSIEKALSPSTAASTTDSTLEIHSGTVSEVAKPSLRGQEVMWALQKAAIEKAKLKQKTRKESNKAPKFKENASYDSGEWRNAKPIVVKAEWALKISELEVRIENLKNPMPLS